MSNMFCRPIRDGPITVHFSHLNYEYQKRVRHQDIVLHNRFQVVIQSILFGQHTPSKIAISCKIRPLWVDISCFIFVHCLGKTVVTVLF